MASNTITKLFNISKGNIHPLTSLSLSQKVPWVSYSTSASKQYQGKHASEETNNGYDGDEAISYSSGTKSKDATNKMEEGKNRMKEGAKEMKDDIPMDGMKEANEKIKERAGNMKDKAKETASVAADNLDEGGSKAAEMVKGAKDKTMGAAETVKEKVAGGWDAVKGTSQKIKESVVGTSDDDYDWGDDRKGKPKVMDEDMVNLRKKVGGIDHHEKKDY